MENLYANPDEIVITDPKVDEYIAKEGQRVLGWTPVAQSEEQRRAKTVSWVRPEVRVESAVEELTLRDRFAIAALPVAAELMQTPKFSIAGKRREFTEFDVASTAGAMADAMLAERKKDAADA